MKDPIELKCPECGIYFKTFSINKVFCTYNCANISRNKGNKKEQFRKLSL